LFLAQYAFAALFLVGQLYSSLIGLIKERKSNYGASIEQRTKAFWQPRAVPTAAEQCERVQKKAAGTKLSAKKKNRTIFNASFVLLCGICIGIAVFSLFCWEGAMWAGVSL
jgi:hypothetical protein